MNVGDPSASLENRLRHGLEPVLVARDPRPKLSAYHDMPYALFRYAPEEEFELRRHVRLLETRLTGIGKKVHRVSLAECLAAAMTSQNALPEWYRAEAENGTDAVVDTIHAVLSEYCPLVDLVAERLPAEPDPLVDIVFIVRTGALFPVYRTFTLLEQLSGRLTVPAVLFYPGQLDSAAGLRFMGVLDAEHNYRPKIF